MNALIGNSGLIGKKLLSTFDIDKTFNSTNINDIVNSKFDIVYCAAPSGNRLYANQHPDVDTASTDKLIDCLSSVTAGKFILISTVDTVHSPDSVYGANRKKLENFVKHNFSNSHIIRLCTLIDKDISKNILYDLTNGMYISSINSEHVVQWYPLNQLGKDVDVIVKHNINEINLVSEPICNKDIIETFFTQYINQLPTPWKTTPYNVCCDQSEIFGNTGPYTLTKETVFQSIKDYLL